ncbi:hypothetical protein PAXRUDRAFT_157558 [Paxillus rubicundulus Ve08.2h10]|uniref:Uncharacterized protein n=1 Tax=Paxillus rubicundulus Ve08.2h10 TaxID=930991 RepID=A0A0D0CYX3_9AGAM|nr:hypothetical protein PAXRUDRAFT_157558 [Paxillus rubicundulus Ve08.2h10]
MLRYQPHLTAHCTFSLKMIPWESTMQGPDHFCGANPKSYTLQGAVSGLVISLVMPSVRSQSRVASEVLDVGSISLLFYRTLSLPFPINPQPAVRPDLAAASPPSALPGALEATCHDCEKQSVCRWLSESGHVCGKPVSCKTAPDHFKGHGITKRNKKDEILCNWECCRRNCHRKHRRSNFIRHMRESHLGHSTGRRQRK